MRARAQEAEHFAYVMPEKPCASWYDNHPELSDDQKARLNTAQREIEAQANAKLTAWLKKDEGRILSKEEIKALEPKITPVSEIPEYHASQPRFI
jgi:hypothetical protein